MAISPMPYDTPVDLSNFITALRHVDLVDLKWGDRGMLCGNPLPENPTALKLIVADEADYPFDKGTRPARFKIAGRIKNHGVASCKYLA